MKNYKLILPLNIDNFLTFINLGYITNKKDFPIGNYAPDSLSIDPDNIILYNGKVPEKAIEMVKKEDKYLYECLLIISISVDETKNSEIDEQNLLKIPTIIPISSVDEVVFEDEEAKEKFITLLLNSNTAGSSITTKKLKDKGYKKLIVKNPTPDPTPDIIENLSAEESVCEVEHQSEVLSVQNDTLDFDLVSAYGGVMAILYVMAKNGVISNEAFKAFLNGKLPDAKKVPLNADFKRLFHFFHPNDNVSTHLASDSDDKKAYELACQQVYLTISRSDKTDCLNQLIMLLTSDCLTANLKAKGYFQKSAELMKNLNIGIEERKTSQLVSDLHKEDRTNLMLYLSFFAIKKDIESILNSKIEGFSEQDYLMLAMYYGMRDGYHGLPKYIRQIIGLEQFISSAMARYALNTSIIEFKKENPPLTLIDMLDGKKLYFENKLKLISKLFADNEARENIFKVAVKTKTFSFEGGSLELSTASTLALKRDEVLFTQYMLNTSPEIFDFNQFIDMANKK